MKKRDDIRAQAAGRDVVNGLTMAARGLRELGADLFGEMIENILLGRAERFLRRALTADLYRDAFGVKHE